MRLLHVTFKNFNAYILIKKIKKKRVFKFYMNYFFNIFLNHLKDQNKQHWHLISRTRGKLKVEAFLHVQIVVYLDEALKLCIA